jgi:hypothetical protein
MNRERLASAALRALPERHRALHGREMLDTLLDASANASRARFARELLDLLRAGLRARARQTASIGTRRLLADGFCLGAILVMTLDLSTLLSQRLYGGEHDPLLSWTSISLLGVILAIALIGAERLAGIAALAWTLARFPELVAHNPRFNGIAPTVVPLICFGVLAISPRRRALELRRLAWLTASALLVVAFGPRRSGGLIVSLTSLAAVLLVVVAVFRLMTDPRLAIACALPAMYVGLMVLGAPVLPALLLALSAPLLMSAAILRIWHLRREAPR